MRFSGKTAIVTGAARGIGRATALLMGREGANVLVADLDLPMGEEVAKEVRQLGGQALSLRVNVASTGEVRQMVHRCRESFGGIDILVNNAGMVSSTMGLAVSEEEWDRVLSVNVKGMLLCCQAAAPAMIERGRGWIVNVASAAGLTGSARGDIPYAVSKAGVLGMTKTLARLLAPLGVNVNAVAPGVVDTELLARGGGVTLEQMQSVGRGSLIGRVARPDEIAETIAFLASEAAGYIIGETICISGGAVIR